MKVYIATTGCYSDYSVRSVHTTREGAEASLKHLEDSEFYVGPTGERKSYSYNREDWGIEEFELDSAIPQLPYIRVVISPGEPQSVFVERLADTHVFDKESWCSYTHQFNTIVRTDDATQAIKVAYERRAAAIALGKDMPE